MSNYRRTASKIVLLREKAFRIRDAIKDEPILDAETGYIDIPDVGEVAVLRSELKREAKSIVGGSRTPDVMSELGFDAIDESISFHLQTGRLIYGVLGECATTGTSYAPALTDTILSGQGTATLTLTGGGLTPNAHVGDLLEVDRGGGEYNRYYITANTANTVTVDVLTAADVNGLTVEITTAPFTHLMGQMEGKCRLPTFAMRVDVGNPCAETDENLYVDTHGVMLKSNEITIETNGDAMQAVSFNAAKSTDGSPLTREATEKALNILKWTHVSTFTFTYDAQSPITKDVCDQIKIMLENNAELKHTVGDAYPNYQRVGGFTATVTLSYHPFNKVLYDLRNTAIVDYASDVELIITLEESASRYIKFRFPSLVLTEHPTGIPSADDAIMGVEAEFQLMPAYLNNGRTAGTAIVEAVDDLDIRYYEGSG